MAAWTDSPFLTGMERTAYDIGVRGASKTPSPRIAVIAIDDESLANIGRWPWPRDVIGSMVGKLTAGGAKVVGLPIASHVHSPGATALPMAWGAPRGGRTRTPMSELAAGVHAAHHNLVTQGT